MSRLAADLICRSLLCFGIAAVVAGFVHEPPSTPSQCAQDSQSAAVFGAYDDTGELVPADVIPLVPGQQFGWHYAVNDSFPHTWREVLITPAAPKEWVGSDLVVTDDGKVGITERTEIARDGILEHAWTITDGDPSGQHELQLYVDGKLVKTFHFLVR